ncbi:hypothetical protein A1O7_02103 [Cladophialophora yegresii CBS 114405]|uniref:Uncharacterized protein n=1 Tax=Cladophialophora yegresii CBS 114405 TaxID=1182544 RepID=W9WTL3_9EURO|nr:uncharacterized protein A1O7_02103 [Cladophialophora yegresii CBS 114405]EXJ61674.1 hypothetical protein A1O7_02103 [Cladophialophora yegresii CBS 114405]
MGKPEHERRETAPMSSAPLQAPDQRSHASGREGKGTDERNERLTWENDERLQSYNALESSLNPPPFRIPKASLSCTRAARSGNASTVDGALAGEETRQVVATNNLNNANATTSTANLLNDLLRLELDAIANNHVEFAEPWYVQEGARAWKPGFRPSAQPKPIEDTRHVKKRSAQPESTEDTRPAKKRSALPAPEPIHDSRQVKKQELEAAQILQGMKYSVPSKYAKRDYLDPPPGPEQ